MINNSQRAFSRFLTSLLCTILVFTGVPFSPASGQSQPGGARLANLPDLNKTRSAQPTPPVRRPPKPATRCRHFDRACKVRTRTARNNAPAAYDMFQGLWAGAAVADLSRRFDWRASNTELNAAAAATAPPKAAAQSFEDFFATARIDEINRTGAPGEDLYSGNYRWSMPLISLPGRAGFDLNLTLYYNSLVWLKSGNLIHFDHDRNWLSPGFSLGFPVLKGPYNNTQAGGAFYLMLTPEGRAVELRHLPSSPMTYEARDGSYTQLTFSENGNQILTMTDGTSYTYTPGQGIFIKDRNGNYMYVYYKLVDEMYVYDTIVDSLGRSLKFEYGSTYSELLRITQNWDGVKTTLVDFGHVNITINTNFSGLTLDGTTVNGTVVTALSFIQFRDGTSYDFFYNTYGQVSQIKNYGGNGLERSWVLYNLPANAAAGAQSDCPRFTKRTDYAFAWGTDDNQSNVSYDTNFCFADAGCAWNVLHTWGSVTSPDGTKQKEHFGTGGTQRGLPLLLETYDGGVKKKWTTYSWQQGGGCASGLTYVCNPRVSETNVYDDVNGNGTFDSGADKRRRTGIVYGAPYGDYNLPSEVTEYKENATDVLRKTTTTYELGSYVSKRIIGLPKIRELRDGANVLLSKSEYLYDEADKLQSLPNSAKATMHLNPTYTVGRGNVTTVRRYDVNSPGSLTAAVENKIKYFTTGVVAATTDGVDAHETKYDYTDKFLPRANTQISTSGMEVSSNKYNTFAYPTKITDPDLFETKILYHYALGLPKGTIDPKGAAVRSDYDAFGRLERVANETNGAYTRYVYDADNGFNVLSFMTLEAGQGEFYSIKVFNGLGLVRGEASEHPGSVGQFKAVRRFYDSRGRQIKVSNPTEIASSWQAAGEDAAYYYTQQTYDWNNRPLATTNQDGTTRSISYTGCGCAGGQEETITDEGTLDGGVPKKRQQKVTHDVLGRVVKTRVLTWESGPVYATTINAYNERDQLTSVKEYKEDKDLTDPNCQTADCQKTDFAYDGHGRLQQRQRPIESAPTTYSYFKDDTVQTMTDARGVASTYSYYNRHLVKDISYSGGPAGGQLSSMVSYEYDELGNRKKMTDGLGTVNYNYSVLGRLDSETRMFSNLASYNASNFQSYNGVIASYTFSYQYNLAGQLTRITDPWQGATIYQRDKAGQITAVNGTGYGNIDSNNAAPGYPLPLVTQARYRAWGETKDFQVNTDSSLSSHSRQHNVRLQTFSLNQGNRATTHTYYNDGRIKDVTDYFRPAFSRYSEYDHAGRLTLSRAGNDSDWTKNPFLFKYEYNAFGNTTKRTGPTSPTIPQAHYWSELLPDFTATWTNQRDDVLAQAGLYAAHGQLGAEADFNQAGLRARYDRPAGSLLLMDRYNYDGDGQQGYTNQYYHSSPHTPPPNEPTNSANFTNKYYLTSTVLGGAAVAEFSLLRDAQNKMWQSYKTRIYFEGQDIGCDAFSFDNPGPFWAGLSTRTLQWNYRNPYTNTVFSHSYRKLTPSGSPQIVLSAENTTDAVGAPVAATDPALNPPPPPAENIELDIDRVTGDIHDYRASCRVDGAPLPCSDVIWRVNHNPSAYTVLSFNASRFFSFTRPTPGTITGLTITDGNGNVIDGIPRGIDDLPVTLWGRGGGLFGLRQSGGGRQGGGQQQNPVPQPAPTPVPTVPPSPCDVSLIFDIASGQLGVYTGNGSPQFISAGSGRDDGCLNNPACSRERNRGPIPIGDYYINVNEINQPGAIRSVLRNLPVIGADWGSFRVAIHPESWTDTFGRGGFYLHGGNLPGSAGCIDVGGGILGNVVTNSLLNTLRRDRDSRIPLSVVNLPRR